MTIKKLDHYGIPQVCQYDDMMPTQNVIFIINNINKIPMHAIECESMKNPSPFANSYSYILML